MKERKLQYPALIPNIRDWPIHKMYQERDELIETVDRMTLEHIIEKHGERIGELISRVAYLELIRLKENAWKVDPPNETQFWKKVRSEVGANDKLKPEERQKENVELLKKIVHRYTTEIAGNFKPSTFQFARRFLYLFFKRMLNAAAGKNVKKLWSTKLELYERIQIHGNVDLVREIFNKGTVVILPTHQSNLDSALIGYALDAVVGLPAFTYGAGLNLFESELFAYYMSRLGAYKVDRRKKNPVYLDSLKIMSQVILEKGTNSIFFPGGTRSRSGEIENELKYGLLNSLLAAQRSMYESGSRKKIIVVPLVIGYHSVLEAQSLINGFLKIQGEEKYMSSTKKLKSVKNVLGFAWKFFSQSSEIHLSFGMPMDVLGYSLDKNVRSIDERGREVNTSEYFSLHGEIQANKQRESVYTRKLAEQVISNYHSYYVTLTSHLVAFTAFQILKRIHSSLDLYGLLRLPDDMLTIPRELFEDTFLRLLHLLKELEAENKVLMQEILHTGNLQEMIHHGVKNLGAFHAVKPLRITSQGDFISKNSKLLFYYQNRLTGFDLEEKLVIDSTLLQMAIEKIQSPTQS